jgi:hypothetical protein
MRRVGIAWTVVGALVVAGYGLYRYIYPSGMRHCCDIQLHFALRDYAEKHGGAFPAGEATPEASLSLIGCEYAYVLCGHSRPESVALETLLAGKLLGPDTCGWNYAEGLRTDSNGRLALFWDKEGLGHDGERLSGGGHIVTFVNGNREHIPGAEWDRFIEEQQKLLAEERLKTTVKTLSR